MSRRIETTTSRTAEMTCLSRAASYMETNACYKSDDSIAPLLLPDFIRLLFHFPPIRRYFTHKMAPHGIYEYVIARTKYMDAVFKQALADQFDQILIFGAGFDSRALRFQNEAIHTRLFELDVPHTQQAKVGQYKNRRLSIPANLTFITIDFDKESLPEKLDEAGFRKNQRSLFILEGLLMYLQPESVQATFHTIQAYAGNHSRVAFDHIYASVLRREGLYYGEADIMNMVSKADEGWHFGIEKGAIEEFLAEFGFKLVDQKDTAALEKTYFSDTNGKLMGRINGTHCLVTAEKL
jgi:methyltransferase (TIGR00027 family)